MADLSSPVGLPKTVGDDTATVLVEAKGDWHPEVRTALQNQLVDRYMKPPYTNGIYVVGFFDDGGDKTTTDERLSELRETLTNQAESFTKEPRVVRSRVVDCRLRLT